MRQKPKIDAKQFWKIPKQTSPQGRHDIYPRQKKIPAFGKEEKREGRKVYVNLSA